MLISVEWYALNAMSFIENIQSALGPIRNMEAKNQSFLSILHLYVSGFLIKLIRLTVYMSKSVYKIITLRPIYYV